MHLLFLTLLLFADLFAKSAQEIVQENHLAALNSILIFTSQDAITSGTYNYTAIGATMDVYHIPFLYHFDSTHDYNYFILGNVGYSRSYITDGADYNGTLFTYDSDLRTYTAGIGGGLRYKLTESNSLLGGTEIIYSRSGNTIKTPHDSVNAAFNNLFSSNNNENITYKFFALAEYRPQEYKFKPYFSLGYKLYQTKSSINYDSLRSFTTQSSVTTATIGAETPKLYNFDEKYITLESYLNSNYLGGDIQKSLLFDNYATLGVITYLYTPKTPSFAKRFFLELSTVRSRGLEGYNAGIGFSADF
jgi:hypothetical protein